MGAIAVSAEDDRKIQKLARRLGVPSKAAVVRLAVEQLEKSLDRDQMGLLIREYVQKYGDLDRKENEEISGGGVAREEE